jgi:hypothetical protein
MSRIFVPGQIVVVNPYFSNEGGDWVDQGVVIKVSFGMTMPREYLMEVIRDTESLIGVSGFTVLPHGQHGRFGGFDPSDPAAIALLFRRSRLCPVDWSHSLWHTIAAGLVP